MRYSNFSLLLILSLLISVLGLAGCSSNPEKDKAPEQLARPLEVPPDLSSLPPEDSLSSGFLNKEEKYSTFSEKKEQKIRSNDPIVKLKKPLLPEFEAIKIYKAGSQQWLVVKSEAEPLWFSIRRFIKLIGFEITVQTPETGIMETNWKTKKPMVLGKTAGFLSSALGSLYATDKRDQYRFRLERGVEPGTMEVYVSHRGMEEVLAAGGFVDVAETIWQPRASDPELEVEVLRLLMFHLGTSEEKINVIAKDITSLEKVKLKKNEDNVTILWMGEKMDRAWRRVGISLDRTYFTVQDRDRTVFIYYVKYFNPNAEAEKGFFSSIIGDDEPDEPQYYQVALRAVEDGTTVEIRDKEGEILDDEDGLRILKLLYKQLK
ncbi:MAG: outer membrane protein assembly factor BamC [Acidiferrobacterales bacterium]